jgi:hypothetical protein
LVHWQGQTVVGFSMFNNPKKDLWNANKLYSTFINYIGYVTSQMVSDKFKYIWKEVVVVYYKLLSQNLLEGVEENPETFQSG